MPPQPFRGKGFERAFRPLLAIAMSADVCRLYPTQRPSGKVWSEPQARWPSCSPHNIDKRWSLMAVAPLHPSSADRGR